MLKDICNCRNVSYKRHIYFILNKSVAGYYFPYVGLLQKPENWQRTADENQSATVPCIDVLRIYDY
jgi:hypothetical protein